MKYRKLSSDELQSLENEFIQFLAANTITADDWQKLKNEDPEKVEQLLELFSDIVLEKSLQKIKYLECRMKKDLLLFECLEDKIKMIRVMAPTDSSVDFTKQMSAADLSKETGLNLACAEKPYENNDRSREIFEMTENDCFITNESMFIFLQSLFPNKN